MEALQIDTHSPGSSELPQIFKFRVATYNILNTSDRYEERERLLKKNIYELNADVIGM